MWSFLVLLTIFVCVRIIISPKPPVALAMHRGKQHQSDETQLKSDTEMLKFVNRYRESVKKSSVRNVDLKENAISEINNAYEQYMNHDSQIESTKIEIVTSAIRVKASFTKPPLPHIQLIENETVFVLIGQQRVRFSDVWSYLRKNARNDFEEQKTFLADKVLPTIIKNAEVLTHIETVYRLQQVESVKIPEFRELNVYHGVGKQSTYCDNYVNLIRDQYDTLKWTDFLHSLGDFEDIYFRIHDPVFMIMEKVSHILRTEWFRSSQIINNKHLEFVQKHTNHFEIDIVRDSEQYFEANIKFHNISFKGGEESSCMKFIQKYHETIRELSSTIIKENCRTAQTMLAKILEIEKSNHSKAYELGLDQQNTAVANIMDLATKYCVWDRIYYTFRDVISRYEYYVQEMFPIGKRFYYNLITSMPIDLYPFHSKGIIPKLQSLEVSVAIRYLRKALNTDYSEKMEQWHTQVVEQCKKMVMRIIAHTRKLSPPYESAPLISETIIPEATTAPALERKTTEPTKIIEPSVHAPPIKTKTITEKKKLSLMCIKLNLDSLCDKIPFSSQKKKSRENIEQETAGGGEDKPARPSSNPVPRCKTPTCPVPVSSVSIKPPTIPTASLENAIDVHTPTKSTTNGQHLSVNTISKTVSSRPVTPQLSLETTEFVFTNFKLSAITDEIAQRIVQLVSDMDLDRKFGDKLTSEQLLEFQNHFDAFIVDVNAIGAQWIKNLYEDSQLVTDIENNLDNNMERLNNE